MGGWRRRELSGEERFSHDWKGDGLHKALRYSYGVFFFFFHLEKYTLGAGIGRSKERHWRRISGPFFFFGAFSGGGFVALHCGHGGGYAISFLFSP